MRYGCHYTKAVEASSNSELPSPQSTTAAAPRRIVLTGFMGSGKTTVGPLIAARLGWSFIDVDDVIEAEAGATIAEFFARHGEAAFRELERATIARLSAGADALRPCSAAPSALRSAPATRRPPPRQSPRPRRPRSGTTARRATASRVVPN